MGMSIRAHHSRSLGCSPLPLVLPLTCPALQLPMAVSLGAEINALHMVWYNLIPSTLGNWVVGHEG
jgi:hypothetical protein